MISLVLSIVAEDWAPGLCPLRLKYWSIGVEEEELLFLIMSPLLSPPGSKIQLQSQAHSEGLGGNYKM